MPIGIEKGEIGSVGQLVGASMETAGHYMQGAMLQALDSGLGSSLGTLLFVSAAVVGLSVFVFTGSYRFARWFLFGPILFFALTTPRTLSSGAAWEFGNRKRPAEAVSAGSRGVRGVTVDGKQVEVSFFFSLWNRLTSSVTQTLVKTVQATNNSADIDFITRAERFESLFNAYIENDELLKFVKFTVVGKCADYYVLMRELYDSATDNNRRTIVQRALDERGKQSVISANEARTSLANLRADGSLQFMLESGKDSLGGELDERTKGNLRALIDNDWSDEAYTCGDLWGIATLVLKANAALYIDTIAESMRSPELTKKEAIESLKQKFDNKVERPVNGTVRSNDDQKMLFMINQVVGRMLLGQIQRANPDLVWGDSARFAPSLKEERDKFLEGDVGYGLREMAKTEQGVGKGDFLTAVLALPYVQGFLLYWLAVSFPFFCLAVIVPGRHGAVFVWMGLWAWVKLWDVGFAITMVIEKVLFALLPEPVPLDGATLGNPGQALKAMLQVDVGYNQNIYYNLMATLLAAVPLITGMIVRRGGQQVVGYVGNRLTTFSGRIGYAMASHSRSLLAQSFAARAHDNYRTSMEDALWRALQKDDIAAALSDSARQRLQATLSQANGWTKVLSEIQNASGEQRLQYARARIKEEIAEAMFAEADMSYNLRYARRAIFQTYYNHDFRPAYDTIVGAAKIEVEKSKYAMQLAQVAGGALGGATGLLGRIQLTAVSALLGNKLPRGRDGSKGIIPEAGVDAERKAPLTPEDVNQLVTTPRQQ